MIIDRRTFIAGAALAVIGPGLPSLPAAQPALATEASTPLVLIEGWSVDDPDRAVTAVWLRIGRSWSAAWR